MTVKIPWAKPSFLGREQEYLQKALESSWISGGMYVDRFESDFAKKNNVSHFITTSNGTTALHLALLAAGIGRDDEVIVPGFSFIAPANMTLAVGAVPVYADIDPTTWSIDVHEVEKKITSRTKAVIATHNYGGMAPVIELKKLCDKNKIFFIEDNAESPFSKWNGKFSGTFGDFGCFSFHATKTITMGEGGGVTTPNPELHTRMRLIRDHGMNKSKRYWHETVGYNFRITNMQGALGCAQLEKIDSIIEKRKKIYKRYLEHLDRLDGLQLQVFQKELDPVVWTLALRIEPKAFRLERDGLIAAMLSVGIETRPGFYPPSRMPFYQAPRLPISEEVSSQIICLPFFEELTDLEIDFVCAEFKKLMR